MSVSDKFVALIALLVLGSWGWGRAATTVLRRAGWEEVVEVVPPPLQILLGVSLFLSVGGFQVAAGVARIGVLVAWHLIGVLFIAATLLAALRGIKKISLRSIVLGATATAVGVVLFLIGVANAVRPLQYNSNDDDGAYIYLAKRLLNTGGLIDSFNQRRLTSYGGGTLYHAMFLRITGNSALRGFEFAFAALILVLATVGTVRRRWLIVG